MTAKTKAPVRAAKVGRPLMAYPEQFRMDCLREAMKLPNQDHKTLLATARALAEFVLGENATAVTK